VKASRNPRLPVENWDAYQVYQEVEYDPKWGWNSRHWLCPVCKYSSSVMHHKCDGCFREKVKKTIGHTRYGNPVERWVMRA
jgi:hypothetical protein